MTSPSTFRCRARRSSRRPRRSAPSWCGPGSAAGPESRTHPGSTRPDRARWRRDRSTSAPLRCSGSGRSPRSTSPLESPAMRADWDSYFMEIARVVASRATCDRKLVGALLVRDRMILSTGYNGSIRGMPHCSEVGHLMENEHCVATIHAEANAVLQAARNGVGIDGADLYTTASPCWPCFKLVANAGIKRIVYGEFYRDDRIFEVAKSVGISLVDMSGLAAKTAAT